MSDDKNLSIQKQPKNINPEPPKNSNKAVLWVLLFILILIFLVLVAIIFLPTGQDALKLNLNYDQKNSSEPAKKPQSYQESNQQPPDKPQAQSQTPIKLDFEILEVADTREERRQGLMNRESICWDCGLIFVYSEQKILSFWMKNTYIPLDIIFVDAEGKIVSISESTQPLDTQKRYVSESEASYAIEVNAGWAKDKNLQTGQILDTAYLLKQGSEYSKTISNSNDR